jgi:hypothetical protein
MVTADFISPLKKGSNINENRRPAGSMEKAGRNGVYYFIALNTRIKIRA